MPDSRRLRILKAVTTRFKKEFGPSGTVRPVFRKVRRGAWRPGRKTQPDATIVDDGMKRLTQEDDGTIDLALSLKIILGLEEDFDRESSYDKWIETIEAIKQSLANWNAIPAVRSIRYEGDDPFTVVLNSGASEEIWVVEFSIEFVDFIGELST